jgi:hypothetical protein
MSTSTSTSRTQEDEVRWSHWSGGGRGSGRRAVPGPRFRVAGASWNRPPVASSPPCGSGLCPRSSAVRLRRVGIGIRIWITIGIRIRSTSGTQADGVRLSLCADPLRRRTRRLPHGASERQDSTISLSILDTSSSRLDTFSTRPRHASTRPRHASTRISPRWQPGDVRLKPDLRGGRNAPSAAHFDTFPTDIAGKNAVRFRVFTINKEIT